MICKIESNWDGLMSAISATWDLRTAKKAMVITDGNVAPLFLENVKKFFTDTTWQVFIHIIPAGEANKNFATLTEILQAMHEAGMDRASVVLALGGGVVSDIAGFAASCYMRGIDYINLPTTLLSQVDSAMGGKTGIDFLGQKNLIGAFHAPRMIYTNTSTLDTLPKQEFISGLAEVIKYGIIYDRSLLDFLHSNIKAVKSREDGVISHIVRRSQNIKMEIVVQDEKDKGLRQILNFGHTVGHAIESLTGFALPHGHCVAIGMAKELQHSVQNHGLSQAEADFAINLIQSYGLPTEHDFDQERILEQMKRDKKNINGEIVFIGISELGGCNGNF